MGHESRSLVNDGTDGDRMLRRGVGCFTLRERHSCTALIRIIGVEAIGDVMRGGRLRWHGHVESNPDSLS